MKELRPLQSGVIEAARASFAKGNKRVVLQASTGFGKTVCAAHMVRGALEKGKRVAFVVDSVTLVDQTVERFYEDGIRDVGVMQASHPMTDATKPVQVCTAQTLLRREYPDVDVVFVDECHERHEAIWRWMERCPDVLFLGMSATPWSKGLGLKYDDLVIACTTGQLIEQGWLCPFRVYAAAKPNLDGVKVRAGEYVSDELSEIMAEGGLIADIVATWQKLGENRPTIAFCVDRAHARKVQSRFQEAGIGCGYIDAFTERLERKEIEKQLGRGDIRVVTSVGCLIKGVDWSIGCLIDAAPTKSNMKHVQKTGRGLRVNPDAGPDCIILDHAGNTLRLGFVTDIHINELDKSEKGKGEAQAQPAALPKDCPACGYVKAPKQRECPSCQFVPEIQSEIEEHAGDLVQINGEKTEPKKAQATPAEKQLWYSSLLHIARDRGYAEGWAANQYREKMGVWPRGLDKVTMEPPANIRSWVKSRMIRYAKSRKRAA